MKHDINLVERLEAVRARFVFRTMDWLPEFKMLRDSLSSGRPVSELYPNLLARCHQISGTAGTLGFRSLGAAAANLYESLDRRSNRSTRRERQTELAAALEVFLGAAADLPDVLGQISNAECPNGQEEMVSPAVSDDCETTAQIMVVEDDELLRDILTETFSDKGWETIEAKNGLEAIFALFRLSGAPSEEIPDLVFLDVDMPQMDGFEVLKLIHASPAWRSIPVLMMTARNDEVDRVRSVFKGAQAYITKPFDVGELTVRISDLLTENRH